MSGRRITDGEDVLNDEGVQARGRLGAGSRVAVKDVVIVGRGIAEAVAPFLDPGEGAMGGSGIVLEGPGRLELEE